MHYLQLSIPVTDADTRDLLIASLSELGAEGFEEGDTALKAFVPESDYDETAFTEALAVFGLVAEKETIAPRNWNAEWESDFEPVIIGDFCTIRAHFHQMPVSTQYDIVITPKMSFGTGHHATTHLMVEQMACLDLQGKKVLDFGTGTGILAILAEKLGAAEVIAIDNDEWSFDNAQENVQLNDCSRTKVSMDDIEVFSGRETFSIILANINRHILLRYMKVMYELLNAGATLLMSGLLTEDEAIVSAAAAAEGFTIQSVNTRNNWITILCMKA
ncbi:MAG TPA: 50S ribosomal protein L11 methyltransferase [Chitinophagaceae bacterium]|nr:50S ribosomal protein L11 methyltransferase [Chitinophagaceae bacterium]